LKAGISLIVPKLGIDASNDSIINDTYRPAQAAGRFGGGGEGDVSVIPAEGAEEGLTLGPDGTVWLLAYHDTTNPPSPYFLQSVSPSTDKVSSYALDYSVPGAVIYYTGPSVFDSVGNLWLIATVQGSTTSTPILIRFDPATGTSTEFPSPPACPSGVGALAQASDGYVWGSCTDYSTDTTALARIAPDGTSTTITTTDENVELGFLAPGPDGIMWAVGFSPGELTSMVEVTPGGRVTVFPDKSNVDSIEAVGNGSGEIIDVASCFPGGVPNTCFEDVAPDGTQTQLAVAPDDEGYNSYLINQLAVDSHGDVWQLIIGTAGGAAQSGEYLFEVTPSGSTKIYPFQFPDPNQSSLLYPTGPPVVASDGAFWTEEQVDDPAPGSLVRFAPQ
jgi:hypothetical protein